MNAKNKLIMPMAVVAAGVMGVAGASLVNSLQAGAASTGTSGSSAATSTTTPPAQPDPSKGGHTANGKTEVVLSGDESTKAIAAAKAAVPGATVLRAETDAEGAAYEVHMSKSDGSQVTVKLDYSFKVTATESGFGGGPGGPGGPRAQNN